MSKLRFAIAKKAILVASFFNSLKQKKIHRLDGNNELPFVLIALSYPESLLKTAWVLNNKLNINLKESESLIQAKDNISTIFPVFCDLKSPGGLFFSLITNKSSNNILIKELQNIDYILEISGAFRRSDISALIKEVKLIPGVVAAIEINPEKIKRKTAFYPF